MIPEQSLICKESSPKHLYFLKSLKAGLPLTVLYRAHPNLQQFVIDRKELQLVVKTAASHYLVIHWVRDEGL